MPGDIFTPHPILPSPACSELHVPQWRNYTRPAMSGRIVPLEKFSLEAKLKDKGTLPFVTGGRWVYIGH